MKFKDKAIIGFCLAIIAILVASLLPDFNKPATTKVLLAIELIYFLGAEIFELIKNNNK